MNFKNNDDYKPEELLRDKQFEEQQKQQESQDVEAEIEQAGIEGESGYGIERERGFDIVEPSSKEEELSGPDEKPIKNKLKRLKKFFLLLTVVLHVMEKYFQKSIEMATSRVQEKVRKEQEYISTYQHYSKAAPGNQAGIFDNKLESQKEVVAEKMAAVVVMKEALQQAAAAQKEALKQGIEAQKQAMTMAAEAAMQSAKAAAKQAADAYLQQIDQVKQGINAAKDFASRMESGVEFVDIKGERLDHLNATKTPHVDALAGRQSHVARGV